MTKQDIVTVHATYKQSLRQQLDRDHSLIKQLAEDMAEAATNIQGQGLQSFLQSRALFLDTVDKLHMNYCTLFADI